MSARVPEHTLKNRSYRTLARVSALCAVSTVRNGRGRARCPGWCPCPPSGRRLGRSRVDGAQTRRVQACSGRLRLFRQRANETRSVAVRKRARPRRNRTQPPGRCPDGPCPDRAQTGRVQAQSGRRACLDGARTGPVQAPSRCAHPSRVRARPSRRRPDGRPRPGFPCVGGARCGGPRSEEGRERRSSFFSAPLVSCRYDDERRLLS